MKHEQRILPWAVFGLLSALPGLSHAMPVVPNFNVAGIPRQGFPHFDETQDVQIKLAKTGTGASATYSLTADYTGGAFLFQYDPAHAFNVVGGAYHLQASFNSAGGLTGGSVAVTGTIPGYNIPGTAAPSSTNLYTADLLAYGTDTVADGTPMAVGFKTGNAGGWARQFQGGGQESIYLYDFNVAALASSFTSPKFIGATFAKASALTTVPLPAALWLFGSALGLLSGFRRRRSGFFQASTGGAQ